MPFTLPTLPYEYTALEPTIDARTMEIHHTKHHQAYTEKLNAALEGRSDFANKSIEELLKKSSALPEDIQTTIRNNGGGFYNHNLFWNVMIAGGDATISGQLQQAIKIDLGGIDELKKQFSQAAINQFGSGWSWLTVEKGKLHICSTPNQDNPLMKGNSPILGLDVWEHAYYLKYQNRRLEYVENWWRIVNWKQVSENFEKAMN